MSLFPHHKLDWNLSRLESHLEDQPEDHAARLELATSCLSRAAFHGGGEIWFARAHQLARTAYQHDLGDLRAMAILAACLVGLERLDNARELLEKALAVGADDPHVNYVFGLWFQTAKRVTPAERQGSLGSQLHAIRAVELACRGAPDAWEPNALLAMMLWEQASGGGRRLVERSQFHTVRALALGPPPDQTGGLMLHLGVTCLQDDRAEVASKLFTKLLDDAAYRDRAQYYLGIVNFQAGRYKNAILYLRQHLEKATDGAKVHARIGMAHLHLEELAKARESCQRALAIDPQDVGARWTLGCIQASEGQQDDALKTFKGILEDAPEHGPAFSDLVRLRRVRGDAGWLIGALRAEVKGFDRLPVTLVRDDGTVHPRMTTRTRIGVLLRALGELDAEQLVSAALEAIDLTTDEGLRFGLWEAVLDRISSDRAAVMARALETPGRLYSAKAGREVLALAKSLPESLLVGALHIEEEDLQRAAVERHRPTNDVTAHRKAIDAERREARAWQALVLLALASQGNQAHRPLLVRWAAEADADLADAARAALVMLGDTEAQGVLLRRARGRGGAHLVEAMVAQVEQRHTRAPVRPLAPNEVRTCTTCARVPADVDHMLVGGVAAVCNLCLTEIALHRRELETDDAESTCALSGRGRFETAAMYVYRKVPISREVVDHGLGHLERESVDRYLAAV